MNSPISVLFNKLQPSLRPIKSLKAAHLASELHALPRCANGCEFGYCTVMAEPWFTRVLNLERKRTERSRKPFILVLLDLEGARELNGTRHRLIEQVFAAVTSFMRETDVIGWYRNDEVLGVIFTELGKAIDPQTALDSISAKVTSALRTEAGPDKSRLIRVSCHVFPDDWAATKPGGRVDSALYPQQHSNSRWLQSAGKRMIDMGGSALALVLLSPLLLMIAAIIKLTSRGPVLFRQVRIGQFGKQFTFFKFRSMNVANNSKIHEEYVKGLIAGGSDVGGNGVFKIQNDPRVTTIGRFIRKTSLDELPQFWNVLKGEMSLVGPRPPVPYEVDVYDLWHRRRLLQAKPGITGLWQVTGRSRTTFDEMVRLDLHYTEFSSLWLDLKILLQTPVAVVAGSGAY